MTTIPPFNEYLGVQVVKMEQGRAEAVLDLAPHHLNGRGVVHGGVLSAVLDTVMGAAVISAIPKEWWCATTSLSVQFLEGGRGGRVSASGDVVRRGKRVAFVHGELRDESGRMLATAAGSWHLWPHRPEVSEAPSIAAVTMRGSGERLRVGKIVAVGRNYADHIREMGGSGAEDPVLFLKPPSALVSGGGKISLPQGLGDVHHEVELVVVIGRGGRSISEAQALDHVLGYAVGFDLTLRGLQSEAKKKGEPWALSKGFDGSAPVSLVAPRDEVGDGSGLAISASVNGEVRQQDTTSKMIHGVAALVAFASRLMTLERGDLLFTGTPAGVGPIRDGDTAVGTIEKVGTITIEV